MSQYALFFKGVKYKIIYLLKFLSMKKVEAIIRKSKFDEVKAALHDIEVNFFSYWDVTGVGNEKQGHVYRGVAYSTSDIQRRYLVIVVSDDFLDKTLNTLISAARTGDVGDGKIFVSEVSQAIRIRTGETGSPAIN
jgi:nitrogen regulatory protein P-II 1